MFDKFNSIVTGLTGYAASLESVAVEAANPYPNSMVGEELEALDQFDAHMESIETVKEAVVENVFEAQAVALESAGLAGIEEIGAYDGALSFEAVGNAIKRGAYNVKIQAKKMIAKIWALMKSIFTFFGGADGRLKSYAKLIKKWRNKLSAIRPKGGKDGEAKEVEIRDWSKLATQIQTFITNVGVDGMKELTTKVKAADVKADLSTFVSAISGIVAATQKLANMKIDQTSFNNNVTNSKSTDELEKFEQTFSDSINDRDDIKDKIKEKLDELKDVDKDTMSITSAQSKLMSWAVAVENKCAQDVKFKKEFDKLSKAWDKAFDTSKLDISDADNQKIAVISRICSKAGTLISDARQYAQAEYKGIVSNIQGLVADMAKVTAKGTSMTAA